jgi:hypothetical protein
MPILEFNALTNGAFTTQLSQFTPTELMAMGALVYIGAAVLVFSIV